MRALVLGAAMAVAATSGAVAQAPETQLLKTARAALRAGLIEPTCGSFYLIDRKQIAEVRLAVRLGLVTVEERRITGWRSDTNIVRVISAEWTAWLRLKLRTVAAVTGSERGIGSVSDSSAVTA